MLQGRIWRWAKRKVIKYFEGNVEYKFARLKDYAEELRRSNKGNTVFLEPKKDSREFKRIYICFFDMKRGFRVGCRYVLGLDGRFLDGYVKGEILLANGRATNN